MDEPKGGENEMGSQIWIQTSICGNLSLNYIVKKDMII